MGLGCCGTWEGLGRPHTPVIPIASCKTERAIGERTGHRPSQSRIKSKLVDKCICIGKKKEIALSHGKLAIRQAAKLSCHNPANGSTLPSGSACVLLVHPTWLSVPHPQIAFTRRPLGMPSHYTQQLLEWLVIIKHVIQDSPCGSHRVYPISPSSFRTCLLAHRPKILPIFWARGMCVVSTGFVGLSISCLPISQRVATPREINSRPIAS